MNNNPVFIDKLIMKNYYGTYESSFIDFGSVLVSDISVTREKLASIVLFELATTSHEFSRLT